MIIPLEQVKDGALTNPPFIYIYQQKKSETETSFILRCICRSFYL